MFLNINILAAMETWLIAAKGFYFSRVYSLPIFSLRNLLDT